MMTPLPRVTRPHVLAETRSVACWARARSATGESATFVAEELGAASRAITANTTRHTASVVATNRIENVLARSVRSTKSDDKPTPQRGHQQSHSLALRSLA